MATKVQAKKKPTTTKAKAPTPAKPAAKERPAQVVTVIDKDKESVAARVVAALAMKETPKEREARERRHAALQQMLLRKRQEILREIEGNLGQSLTEDQQRRLESARDVGDQALMDLERELGISLMETRARTESARNAALKSARSAWRPCHSPSFASSASRNRNCWRKSRRKRSATSAHQPDTVPPRRAPLPASVLTIQVCVASVFPPTCLVLVTP